MKKRKPERLPLRVVKGGFQPADGYTQARLRAKGFKTGDVVMAQLSKCRDHHQHKRAHRLGQLVTDNIAEFEGLDAHACLKRLQWEAGIGCETLGAKTSHGYVEVRIPKSLSFADMDDGEFHEVFRGLARHIAAEYWPDLTADQIEEMAKMMPGE